MHWVRGNVTRQAHVDLPAGTVEEEYARRGFFGRTTHLYRTRAPVEWTAIEGDIRPEAIAATELPGLGASGSDWVGGRIAFLENEDVRLHMARLGAAMPYAFRNADADEILFIHHGAGRVDTDFGPLAYERGDYLVLPRGAAYRLAPTAETTALVIESAGEVELPDRGLLGRHALFDPDILEVPTPAPVAKSSGDHVVVVQRNRGLSRITYPFDPLGTTVGWKGDLAPYRLNIRDIRPVASERYHLPPPVHATFVMPSAVVCTFLPRPLETGDPNALRVPFYHANIDYDEVLFYHSGDFFSRAGIRPGMVTFHPQGIHHGPQPQAAQAASTKTRTNEEAVMVDTRRPLALTAAARRASIPEYWKSWMQKEAR
ncbi:MAG: homogentisate 1,2-dioxygenase [Deltaproteobacteria bacterium]|nr:homogentisate 1,2-dioxygenase [Deltaproteobacteria bacterium]